MVRLKGVKFGRSRILEEKVGFNQIYNLVNPLSRFRDPELLSLVICHYCIKAILVDILILA
jgi:hypothetical protein